ncbi:hypothetical protein CLIB1444_05S04346 [[Candida] jaroonii]|uniref:Uncharacterized protein n=1 Tax=[Candida] jaroonii TaxID=467808 RepID=A0ACA9Y8W7_9ASCO|nr:hypothetical protein CLIB1444_05S04346 [[Candida] jaroonii]
MSINQLEADYVFVYGDKKSNELTSLIELLHDKGFYTQIRDNDENSLLVFLKIASYRYSELAEKDLIKNYEFGVVSSIDNQADKLRIINEYLTGSTIDDLNLNKFKHVKDLTPITPIIKFSTIYQDVSKHLLNFQNPSSNFIKENFGIHIAIYFEFLKYLLVWLFFLSIFGLISYFKSKHVFSLTYCFVNLIWGVLFISFWKKREKYLINYWGNANYHYIQDHKLKLVNINEYFETKSSYKHNSNYEGYKFLKQLIFVPISLIFMAVLVCYQLCCFALEIFINEIYDGPGKSFVSLVPTVLISVFVPIFSMVYNAVVNVVIKLENHNNSYTESNSILIKQFILNFLTSYMPLLITSFIYLPFAHLIKPNLTMIRSSIESNLNSDSIYYKYLTHLKNQSEFNMNQDRLNLQFNYFIVTNQVVQLVMKYVLPHIISFVMSFVSPKTYKPKDNEEEAKWLDNVRKYVSLPYYNVNDDFRFIVVNFGYLVLFGPVWSLAPLITMIFFIITIKLDYFKLLNGKYFKPPVPERVDSIYPWNYGLFILSWIGSIVAPAITTFYRHGNLPPKSMGQFTLDKASINVKTSNLIFILLISEHVFLIIWFVLNKIFSLFKSDIEWENDFSDNDIKLRHDYYSGKVKGSFPVIGDGEWEGFQAKDSITQATSIIEGGAPVVTSSVPVGKSSGIDTRDYQELKNVKDKSDDIIKVPSQEGGSEFATIDNVQHIDPKGDFNEVENRYQQDFEAKNNLPQAEDIVQGNNGEEEEEEEIEDIEDNDSTPSSGSKPKKRSPLKKLLKRNK